MERMARHKDAERDQIVGETRQLLLQAAAQEFAREGFGGANVNRISRAAGFAKGTIYNYFDSKRALMLALIDETARSHVNYVAERVRQEEEPRRRLEAFFKAGFAFIESYLDQGLVMIQTLYGHDLEFKEQMYAGYRPMFGLVGQDIVAAGIARGDFRPVDPGATATMLMTIYLGTGSQMGPEGRPWLDPGEVATFAWHALARTQSSEIEE
jgi:AcrR family transcriptional regulator